MSITPWNWDKSRLRKWCERTAGPLWPGVVESKGATRRCLTHSAPNIRMVALILLLYHWHDTDDLPSDSQKMALEDHDPDVRETALLCLGVVFSDTCDRLIGQWLARLVCDRSQPTRLRFIAYRGLLRISGIPFVTDRSSLNELLKPSLPEHVDWGFVRSFLPEGEKEVGSE